MTFPARGALARDTRTGQVVRVHEEGRGRSDWMVRPVYKSDGYWTRSEHLEPARDPHAWTPASVWGSLAFLALEAVAAWHTWNVTDPAVGLYPRVVTVVMVVIGAAPTLLRGLGLYRP